MDEARTNSKPRVVAGTGAMLAMAIMLGMGGGLAAERAALLPRSPAEVKAEKIIRRRWKRLAGAARHRPHQGLRERERRCCQIIAGQLTEANGLVRGPR